jgi:hypothetical protein
MTRAVLTVTLLGAGALLESSQGVRFPERLDTYFKNTVRLTAAQRQQLAAGQPVTKLLDADENKEVAVFGAIWIAAPMRRYLDAVADVENFERGAGFRITKKLSAPPRLEDFAQLQLPADDIADLRTCRVGSCEVKLSENGVNRIRSEINWNAPDVAAAVNRLAQQIAVEYVTGYVNGGNAELAVLRDGSRPTFVAQEFRSMVDAMPELTSYLPAVRRYLLDYPKAAVQPVTSFLYWQETQFGLKPTIRINHLSIFEDAGDALVASKMLYANHYFWTGLELRALVQDPARGPGFWFVAVSRSRSDGLSGFTGTIVRRRVRGEVQEGSLAALRTAKQRLEAR